MKKSFPQTEEKGPLMKSTIEASACYVLLGVPFVALGKSDETETKKQIRNALISHYPLASRSTFIR